MNRKVDVLYPAGTFKGYRIRVNAAGNKQIHTNRMVRALKYCSAFGFVAKRGEEVKIKHTIVGTGEKEYTMYCTPGKRWRKHAAPHFLAYTLYYGSKVKKNGQKTIKGIGDCLQEVATIS